MSECHKTFDPDDCKAIPRTAFDERAVKNQLGVLPGLLIGRYTLSVSCFPAHVLEWRAFDKTSFWAVLAENKREDP